MGKGKGSARADFTPKWISLPIPNSKKTFLHSKKIHSFFSEAQLTTTNRGTLVKGRDSKIGEGNKRGEQLTSKNMDTLAR